MNDNKLKELIEEMSDEYQTISYEDNKEGIKYTITKDKNNNKYIIETIKTREFDSSENIDTLFKEMNNYFDLINEEDYWPNENEYPDLYVLWRTLKSGKEEYKKSGSLKYPDDWDVMLKKIEKILENNK